MQDERPKFFCMLKMLLICTHSLWLKINLRLYQSTYNYSTRPKKKIISTALKSFLLLISTSYNSTTQKNNDRKHIYLDIKPLTCVSGCGRRSIVNSVWQSSQ